MNLFLPKLEFFLKKILKENEIMYVHNFSNVGFHGTHANDATEINLVFSFSGMFYLYDTTSIINKFI